MLKNSSYGYSDYGMFNSIWTCIGPTSRLHHQILDNSVLFTIRLQQPLCTCMPLNISLYKFRADSTMSIYLPIVRIVL